MTGGVMSTQSRARAVHHGVANKHDARPATVLHTYPYWFYLPAALVFGVFFLVPTVLAFYFSLTRWSLFDATFIGLDNLRHVPGRSPAHLRAAQHDHLCRDSRAASK